MSVKKWLFVPIILLLAVACGDDDDDAQTAGLRYTGDIPRFSVDPLNEGGVPLTDDSTAFAPWVKPLLDMVGVPSAVAQNARIDCSIPNQYVNDAPQIYGQSGTNEGMDYAQQFYAQAIFYDCNARQQVQEDGVSRSEQEDPGDPTAEEIPVLTAKVINSAAPEDTTRFVSWSDVPDADDVSGVMINKYRQDDNARTKTRIDLRTTGGMRSVWGVLYYDGTTRTPNATPVAYTKFAFREVDTNNDGTIDEHRVSGRHWDSVDQTVVAVKARAIRGAGVSIFTWRCSSVAEAAINSACDTTANADDEDYYDEGGTGIIDTDVSPDGNQDEVQAAGLDTDDQSTNLLAIGDYFFPTGGGGTRDDFFYVNPSTDPDQPGAVIDLAETPM